MLEEVRKKKYNKKSKVATRMNNFVCEARKKIFVQV